MFTPNFGSWSIEDFSSSSGLSLDTYQTITGGYLSMSPLTGRGLSYTARWYTPTGWSFSNNLNSISNIENNFIRHNLASIQGQSIDVITSGAAQLIVQGGAWNIETRYPRYVGSSFSGQQALGLLTNYTHFSPTWHYYFKSGGSVATIEVDVSSIYDVHTGIMFGYTTGQENITSLPRLSGFLNHGIYIDNGTSYEFIEVNPNGIRLYNHPELGIASDFTNVNRLRIGIEGSNIYLSTEDGRGMAGIGKFDTAATTNQPRLFFGAPPLQGTSGSYPFFSQSVSGFIGNTFWDNIKVLYGVNLLSDNSTTGFYTTLTQTGFTSEFDPGVSITKWNHALVRHTQHVGGVTTVTAQYSGDSGWSSYSSITITGQESPTALDLSDIPIFFNTSTGLRNKVTNPVRFMISQRSFGRTQPASLDSIEVYNTAEQTFIDMVPNWKQSNQSSTITISVDTGKFYSNKKVVDPYCSIFVDIPDRIGSASTGFQFNEKSRNELNVILTGSYLIGYGGPDKNFYRNYVVNSGTAITNSEASNYFGESEVNNIFPNPLLENGFYSITGDPAYVINRSYGNLANNLKLVPSYTGRATIFLEPAQTFDPIRQADALRVNEYLGNTRYPGSQIVQTVFIPGGSFSGSHDSTCGIEAVIPSGIGSGQLLVSTDLKMILGTGLQVYVTGSVQGNYLWTLNGEDYREYKTISFPIIGNTGSIYIGYIAQSGSSSSENISFLIDNIVVSPIDSSYGKVPFYSGELYNSGLYRDSLSGFSTNAPIKSDTVISFDTKIVAYPTGTNNSILRKYDPSNNGYNIYIDQSGKLSFTIDTITNSWTASAASPNLIPESKIIYTGQSNYVVPLDTWTNIGLCHQVNTYKKLSYANYTGASSPVNFASSNRAYLTIDGYPVLTLDLMKNWKSSHDISGTAPYVSYIPDNSGVLTFSSGVLMEIDNINISHPVYADTEINQSIKNAKITPPYFAPNEYFKPTSEQEVFNVLIYSGNSFYGDDLYIGSLYNFDNPGYPYWDHGSWRNHLLFFGDISRSSNNPYRSDLGSTYFSSGSYAIAYYSSATERLINHTGNIGLSNNLSILSGEFKVGGWIRPFTSGQKFFHILQDVNNFTGVSISLGYDNNMKLLMSRNQSSTNSTWSVTGTYSHNISGWNWFEFHLMPGEYTGAGQTGQISLEIRSLSGLEVSTNKVGLNYGFQYMGRISSPSESCLLFGSTCEAEFSDWMICPVYSSDRSWVTSPLGDKSGSYQVLLENNSISSNTLIWSGYNNLITVIPTNEAGDYFYSLGAHNYFYGSSRMNEGIRLYDDIAFRSVPSYFLSYDKSEFNSIVGTNSSPIRIGNQVPEGAINIARVSSQEFTSEASISTIDLSYMNKANLATYKDGIYTIKRNGGATGSYSETGSFKGINSGTYTSRSNHVMSGQVQSENITVSSIAIANPNLSDPTEAFYYYLVGRGRKGVKVNNFYPHVTGHPKLYETGTTSLDNYIFNLEEVNNSIKLTDSDGKDIDFNTYPYSVVTSSYTPENLFNYSTSGVSFDIAGIGSITGVTGLPDGVFTTLLLLNKKTIASDNSVWINYQSYDYYTSKIDVGYKEIVNPVPIMRKKFDGSISLPGQYSISTDSDTYLQSITLYGINSGYTSKL